MYREQRELPTDNAYDYTPRSGDRSAKNPPISTHLFQALFYTCRSPCKWPSILHDCMEPPDGNEHLRRIPKRDRCFQTDWTSPIWGLEGVFAVSFIHVFCYHCLMVAGPFIFFVWWLSIHPNDLQNATVPVTITLGALSLFWSSSGLLMNINRD